MTKRMEMTDAKKGRDPVLPRRRELLRMLGGLGILGLGCPGAARPGHGPRDLSLKEADFYRAHDLAG